MTATSPRTNEQMLLCAFLALHFALLFMHWGEITGHDAEAFLGTVHRMNIFGSLPDFRMNLTDYHPPLSFLLAKAFSVFTGNPVTGTQLLSSLSFLGAFLLLRSSLKRVDTLYTTPGIIFLYTSLSLPAFIYLARAITYDSFQFFLTILTLYLSIRFFWQQSAGPQRRSVWLGRIFVLSAVLTAGLLTKYSCLLNFFLPFFVLLIRMQTSSSREYFLSCIIACSLALLAVVPFYYIRYYQTEGSLMPVGMEWQRPEDLAQMRFLRDTQRVTFLLHMLRVPSRPFWKEAPVQDSLWHRLWFDTWKGDPLWGPQTKISDLLSTFYATTALPLFFLGIMFFLWKWGRTYTDFSDFGWLLLLQSTLSCIALLAFAYQYPLFDWGIFKAEYVPIVPLFLMYCVVVAIHSTTQHIPRDRYSTAILAALLAFMSVNHLLPVY
ncbi:hypothetical protein A2454_00060 [Candidatus Peribacteria bacterium RIFOXYC2_FULL_55_14]|nr:MAG: hypothetical protein A2198_02865 [Candidatus Peribacteria bacterium RIFOXYA1_FULL_56_14]OGJ74459.1 MAG: hypothetical protein A2217_01075 [Candidatus Peribacteria bacterium RIFOXYA2_FULL_55_28]OGJ75664.1 MAG: hypothetical protein A2384_03780 [Candidatus Peribacteria bacterium RIFOXYB1_FULL_54_35]OGJ76612.1 MAG: hypothetical protein A2327_02520 [Candidatus Peribacteria bacterium RIFOXYB2_FULL_54_17]OGJ76887.1 MAG: hypothetical protein A2424_02030 [Candidatus Peribacteria bacterium RIFOXYC